MFGVVYKEVKRCKFEEDDGGNEERRVNAVTNRRRIQTIGRSLKQWNDRNGFGKQERTKKQRQE